MKDYRKRSAVADAHCREWCRVVNDGLRKGFFPTHFGAHKFGYGWFAVPEENRMLYRAVKLTHAEARRI